jgi:hypothetical protein
METEAKTVIDKIKKLMALSSDSTATQNEVETSVMLIQRLLLKSGLSMEDIYSSVEDGSKIEEVDSGEYSEMKWYFIDLADIIANNFRCGIIINTKTITNMINGKIHIKKKKSIHFIGRKLDVEITKDLYVLLRKRLIKDLGIFYKSEVAGNHYNPGAYINTYTEGWLLGLKNKLYEQVNQYALVVVKPKEVKDILDSLDELKSKTKKSVEDSLIQNLGFEDGSRAGQACKQKSLNGVENGQ